MNNENYTIYTLTQLVHSATDLQLTDELKLKLSELILAELGDEPESDISEIIAQVFNNEKKDFNLTYNWAIQTLKFGQIKLSEKYKNIYIKVLSEVIRNYSSFENKTAMIQRLQTDIGSIS